MTQPIDLSTMDHSEHRQLLKEIVADARRLANPGPNADVTEQAVRGCLLARHVVAVDDYLADRGGVSSSWLREWTPDWASPPADMLMEILEARGMTAVGLARATGEDVDEIRRVLTDDAPLSIELALKLEACFQIHAQVWMRMETDWRVYQARKAQE